MAVDVDPHFPAPEEACQARPDDLALYRPTT
jgi:hypothetical protein